MKMSNEEKYLGDQINCNGLAASVEATIKKRIGKVTKSIYDIRAVIEDVRIYVAGGLTAGLDIWELAVIPYLLNNCDTWFGISEHSVKLLDNLQNQFYRVFLKIPTGCPIPSLYWECGGLIMKYRILKKKLLFLHHLETLDETSLANQFYKAQLSLKLPGLMDDCQSFLEKYDLVNIKSLPKIKWKKIVRRKIEELNKSDLLSKMTNLQKIDGESLAGETFKLKSYFKELNVTEARMKFHIRSSMVRSVKMNYPSDPQFKTDLWECQHCFCIDTQSHIILTCPAYEELRVNKNLENDKDLVQFFKEVLDIRDEN